MQTLLASSIGCCRLGCWKEGGVEGSSLGAEVGSSGPRDFAKEGASLATMGAKLAEVRSGSEAIRTKQDVLTVPGVLQKEAALRGAEIPA